MAELEAERMLMVKRVTCKGTGSDRGRRGEETEIQTVTMYKLMKAF